MKRTLCLVYGLCAFTFVGLPAKAGADIVIYYDGRPGITHQNVPLLNYVFFQLDNMRTDIQQSVASDVDAASSKISSVDFSLAEDLSFEMKGLTSQRVAITAHGFRSHLFFKFKCPLNIKKAKVDVNVSRAEVRTNYDLLSGSEPYNANLYGFNIRVRPGISVCTFGALFNWWLNVFGIRVDDFIENLLEDTFKDRVEEALDQNFNLQSLGYSFLDLDPYIQAMPNHLFNSIGVSKNEILDILRNPFSGIRLRIAFDEDGVGYNGSHDQLKIWIDVPWEEPPVASFTHTLLTGTDVRLDASSSYDPDGGSLTYEWRLGTTTIIRNTPILYFPFPSYGPQYAHLKVTDDEGAISHETKYIEVCDRNNPLQITCGSSFP